MTTLEKLFQRIPKAIERATVKDIEHFQTISPEGMLDAYIALRKFMRICGIDLPRDQDDGPDKEGPGPLPIN